MTSEPTEWEFGVPADRVDFERLAYEWLSVPVITGLSYLGMLKKNAPRTYELFKQSPYAERVRRHFVLE